MVRVVREVRALEAVNSAASAAAEVTRWGSSREAGVPAWRGWGCICVGRELRHSERDGESDTGGETVRETGREAVRDTVRETVRARQLGRHSEGDTGRERRERAVGRWCRSKYGGIA